MQTKFLLPIPPVIFTSIYVVAISLAAFLDRSDKVIVFLLHMVVLTIMIVMAHLRTNLSTPLLWCLSLWGLLHMAGGLVRIPPFLDAEGTGGFLYSLSIISGGVQYDQAVHAYGFGVTTWLCWELLRNAIEIRYRHRLNPTLGIVFLCGVMGLGFGALNEVIEFTATLVLPGFDVGGYVNTGWDLVYNLLGALAVGSIIYSRGYRQRRADLAISQPEDRHENQDQEQR